MCCLEMVLKLSGVGKKWNTIGCELIISETGDECVGIIRLFSLLLLMLEMILNTSKRKISLQIASDSGLTFYFFKF